MEENVISQQYLLVLKTRISRCTDQQVLPVNILRQKKYINIMDMKGVYSYKE